MMSNLLSRLWSIFLRKSEDSTNWMTIEDREDLRHLLEASHSKPQLIFKHSPRCSISSLARKEVQGLQQMIEAGELDLDVHMVDVVNARNASNIVRETFDVRHESPQYLLIYKGDVINHGSHMGVRSRDIITAVEQQLN